MISALVNEVGRKIEGQYDVRPRASYSYPWRSNRPSELIEEPQNANLAVRSNWSRQAPFFRR